MVLFEGFIVDLMHDIHKIKFITQKEWQKMCGIALSQSNITNVTDFVM